MNYSELLHDWLDGSLPSEHEEALFIALGKDTALRSEMQDLMRLRAAVQNDTSAFTPSPADTSAIFGKLGFAVPEGMPSLATSSVTTSSMTASSVTVPSATATGVAANAGLRAAIASSSAKGVLKRLVGGIGSVIASACVASLITILLLDWRNGTLFGGNRESVGGNTFQNQAFTPPPDPNAPFFNANPPLRNGFVFDTLRGTASQVSFQAAPQVVVREIIREIVRYAAPTDLFSNPQHYSISNQYAQQSGSNSASNLDVRTLAQEPPTPPKSEQTSNRESSPNLAPQANASPTLTSQTPAPQALAPSTNAENPSVEAILQRFRLGVRGFATLSLPAPNLKPSAADFLNNAAISLYYALSPNHAIGIEAGQEAFYQQYITTENQDTYTIAQYPTQMWGGVSYRYTLLPEQAFTPFAGATVGLAGYGVMGRAQLGCSYAPDGGITQFILGVEASSLFYGHQGANYFSPKVGVTYGVMVRL